MFDRFWRQLGANLPPNLVALRLKMSNFDFLKINVASPKRIKSWGTRTLSDGIPVGELLNPDTLYYRDLRPIVGGLFCDRIFGPLKILKCRCCRYKGIRRKNQICPKCGIEVKLTRLGRRHYFLSASRFGRSACNNSASLSFP